MCYVGKSVSFLDKAPIPQKHSELISGLKSNVEDRNKVTTISYRSLLTLHIFHIFIIHICVGISQRSRTASRVCTLLTGAY